MRNGCVFDMMDWMGGRLEIECALETQRARLSVRLSYNTTHIAVDAVQLDHNPNLMFKNRVQPLNCATKQ